MTVAHWLAPKRPRAHASVGVQAHQDEIVRLDGWPLGCSRRDDEAGFKPCTTATVSVPRCCSTLLTGAT